MPAKRPSKPKARAAAPVAAEAATPLPAPAIAADAASLQAMFKGKAKQRPERYPGLMRRQRLYVQDTSRNRLLEKGRQTGGDYINGCDAVRKLAPVEAKFDMFVSSRDLPLAKQFLRRDVKKWAAVYDAAAEDLGEQIIDPEKKLSSLVFRFASGREIHSLSSNPDAHAGKTGHRKLNEFALLPDNREQYKVAKDGTRWGGNLDIWSTHRGTKNFFNELIQEILHKGNPKKFSHHRIRFSDALEDGLLYCIQMQLPEDDPVQDMDETDFYNYEKDRAESPESFMEENECVPQDDASCFIDFPLITPCEYGLDDAWQIPLDECQGQLFAGFDVARKKDLSVITVLESLYGLLFTRALIVMERERFAIQRERLYEILRHPRLMRCCIDQTGIGHQLAEEAQEKFGFKVEPVTFTPASKEQMAYPMRAVFEERSIKIPHDRKLQNDLRAVKKIILPGGGIRFAADNGTDGHSDRFWSYALAIRARSAPVASFAPMPFRSAQGNRYSLALADRRNRSLIG